jgi:hypothetical protein
MKFPTCRRLAIAAAMALLPAVTSALIPTAAAQDLRFKQGALPTKEVAPNAVYGVVKFQLELVERNSGRPSSRSFYDVLLQGLEGILKKDGEYILSVEVLGKNDEVLARRAIVQVKRSRSGWWIFNRVVKDSETTEWYGDLVTSMLVRPDSNNVRIKVRSYFSETSKLDLQTFNLFVDILAKSKVLGAANTAIDAVWKPLSGTIETLLSSYVQTDISDIAALSFTKFDGTPYPIEGNFFRDVDVERDNTVPLKLQARVRVKTETREVRVVRALSGGKVAPLTTYADVLAAALVGDQPIDSILGASKKEAVKKFFTDLNSTGGYAAADIGEKCDGLQGEMANYFTVPDKVITYWALLHLYRRKISINKNAADCLDSGVKRQMLAFGLPLDDLPFAKTTPVVASNDKSAPAGAAEKPDRVIASQTQIDRVLGEKNSVRTFQVFPITQ